MKGKKRWIYVVLLCVVFSLFEKNFATNSSAASIPKFTETNLGNLPGNSNNGGLAVTNGKYIYYVSLYGDRIDRMDMNGTNNLNVTKAAAKCLNIIDDWIYYADKDLKGIYKVKTDGTEKTLIKEDVDPNVMQVTDSGWIYYTDSQNDNKLYRIAESGDDLKRLSKFSIGEFIVFKNHVVVQNETKDYNLYWISLNKSSSSGRMTKFGISSINYAKGKFYYVKMDAKDALYSMSGKATAHKRIRKWKTNNAIVYKNNIYFTSGDEKIYVQTLTGKKKANLLSKERSDFLCVVGKQVVYAVSDLESAQIRYVNIDGSGDRAIPLPIKTVTGLDFNDGEVRSVILSKTSTNIVKGNEVQLTATVSPENSANKTITWSSSNTNIATVGKDGLVYAKATGNVTITATSNNGKKGTCTVKVLSNEVLPTSMTLSKTSATIDVGGNIQLVPTIYPSTVTNKNVTWVSNNTSIIKVSQTGLVTGVAAGKASLTVKTSNGKSASCTITVKALANEVLPTSIKLSKTSSSINIGEKFQLVPTIYPSTATNKNVTWVSSNTSAVKVDQNGWVTGVAAGQASITAKTSNGKYALCTVSVKSAGVTSGDFEVYNLTGKDIKELYMTTSVISDWGNNLVSSGNVLKNNDSGTLKISFNKTTVYDILVKYTDGTEGDFRGLSFSTASSTGGAILLKQNEVSFHPVINVPLRFTNNTGKKLTELYVSSNLIPDWGNNLISSGLANYSTKVVTLPMTSFDVKWDIRATWDNAGKKETFELNGTNFASLTTAGTTIYIADKDGTMVFGIGQKPSTTVDVTNVTLNVSALTLEPNQTGNLTSTILPANATTKTVIWSSNNESIAKVSSTGVVTALKEGTATITVTSSNGKLANCVVTVQKKKADLTTGIFTVFNAENKKMTEFYMTTSDSKDYGLNLLDRSAIEPFGTLDLTVSFDKNTSYDIMVKYSDSSQGDYRALSFATASANGGAILLKNGTAELHPCIIFPLTIKNSTQKQITGFESSSSLNPNWSGNLLSQPINDGSTVICTYPMLSFDTIWDVKFTVGAEQFELRSVDFGALNAAGAVLEFAFDSASSQYTYTIK